MEEEGANCPGQVETRGGVRPWVDGPETVTRSGELPYTDLALFEALRSAGSETSEVNLKQQPLFKE